MDKCCDEFELFVIKKNDSGYLFNAILKPYVRELSYVYSLTGKTS